MDPNVPGFFSPAVLRWLEEHGAGYVIGAVWIWTLLRDRTALLRRSEKLSDTLCRCIESGSAERSRLADEYRLGHDWTVRSLLETFTALVVRRESSAPDLLPPKPRPPAKPAASEPIPPPLPDAPKPRGQKT